VTPAIIDDIVEDFRLDVVGPREIERDHEGDGADVQRAAKTLLDLYASMQKSRADSQDGRVPVGARLP
jgi:hypothetical protein